MDKVDLGNLSKYMSPKKPEAVVVRAIAGYAQTTFQVLAKWHISSCSRIFIS